MPAGRYFQSLTAFDLLGNFLPGVVLVTIVLTMLPSPSFPSSGGEYLVAGITAFSLGHFIQMYASRAMGNRQTFIKSMDVARQPLVEQAPSEEETSKKTEETPPDDMQDTTLRSMLHTLGIHCGYAFGMPILWWQQNRGQALDNRLLANRVWKVLFDKYDIERETENYSVLFHVMVSEVEDIDVPSRTSRFQAIRNFHRGMWIVFWIYFIATFFIAVLLTLADPSGQFLGLTIKQPALFDYWNSNFQVLFAIGAITVGFWYLADDYEEEFIEYLFTDYVVISNDNHPEVHVTVNRPGECDEGT